MSEYGIDYKQLGIWIAALGLIIGGLYYFQASTSGSTNSLSIDYDQNTAPGEVATATVQDSETSEPVSGATVYVNSQETGETDENGEIDFRVPEGEFELRAESENYESTTTQASSNSNNDNSQDDNSSDNQNNDENDNDDSTGNEDNQDSQNNDDSQNDDSSDNHNNNQEDEQNNDEASDGSLTFRIGFTPPEVGQTNYVELVNSDGEPVQGENISLNGEEIGLTDGNGRVNFNVPNTQEIMLETGSGLEASAGVNGYEAPSNETDDGSDENTTETGQTGIFLDSDPVSNTNNRVILYENGERISGETVYLDGEEIGQTGSNGAIEFSVPLKNQITISTDYDLESETFNVQENHPEPEITLLSPDNGASFDTPTGTNTDITFEASVEITENTGTASIMIDGSEAYTQDLSQGENSISTKQALSGGTHDWSVEVGTPEYDVSSSSRSLTINEVEVQNGLSLQNNATAGEYNYVRLYDSGEPVDGAEITVNGDSIGTTDSNGEIGFEVQNVPEITVSASGYPDITRTVEGYEEADTPLFYSANIQNPGSGEIQTPFEFSATVDAGLADSYEIVEQGSILYSGSLEENSTNSISQILDLETGEHQIILKAVNSENGEEKEAVSTTFTVESDPVIFINPQSGHHLNSTDSIDIDIKDSSNEEYQVLLDGKRIDQGLADSDLLHLNYNYNFFNENHNLQVNIGSDSYSTEFTSETYPDPSLNLVNPGTVNGFNAYSNFTVDSELDYNYEVVLDGETVESDSSSYQNSENSVLNRGLPQGDHTMQVLVKPVQSHQNFTTDEISFETTEKPPLGEVEWGRVVSSGDTQMAGVVSIGYRAYTYEPSNYEFIIDGSVVDERSFDKGETFPIVEEELTAGEYSLKVNISDQNSSEEITAAEGSITVE